MWRETRHFDRLGSYKTWINENKRSKTLFMVVACLVLHLAFPLEHSKIKTFLSHATFSGLVSGSRLLKTTYQF